MAAISTENQARVSSTERLAGRHEGRLARARTARLTSRTCNGYRNFGLAFAQ